MQALKRFARWFFRPLGGIVSERLEKRLKKPEQAIKRLQRKVDEQAEQVRSVRGRWEQHVPVFLGTTTALARHGRTQKALEDQLATLQAQVVELTASRQALEERLNAIPTTPGNADWAPAIKQLWDRLDVVRSEVLIDQRYGQEKNPRATTRIVDERKLEEARTNGAKLNLGSGHAPLHSYINVDARALPGVDLVADVHALPFESGSVARIFSSHLLEHFPQADLARNLLPHWFDILRDGGTFAAIVPDGEAMTRELASSKYPFEEFREVLFGGQDYAGDFHYNMFTPDTMKRLLGEAGFIDVEIVATGRRNGKSFEFEVEARKPVN